MNIYNYIYMNIYINSYSYIYEYIYIYIIIYKCVYIYIAYLHNGSTHSIVASVLHRTADGILSEAAVKVDGLRCTT